MVRDVFGERLIQGDGGGRGRRHSGLPLIWLPLAVLAELTCAAWAGPGPVTQNGLPVQVVPSFEEVGAPQFSFPQGGLVDTGAVTGTPVSGPGAGGPGGGYSGTGNGVAGATVATDYSSMLGQSVGSGQCVALAQATSDVGLTSTWVPGSQVEGNTNLAPGTVIATFGADGQYTNTVGQSHTAIYLGQNSSGIQVEDQYAGQPAYVHTIAWTTTNSYESGAKFYVVSH